MSGETHWLDRGKPNFGDKFVADVKAVYNVSFMMLPFPIFWALFDQQGSRWTFQASRMNGDFFGVFTLQPDNIQVANAILILVMIPIFNSIVYPALGKTRLYRIKSTKGSYFQPNATYSQPTFSVLVLASS